ncbi:transcription termination factor MTERF8, chloroplastic-like [Silene latifolia]|uniref:transcription termination factor MTERF8, chloroplastic-like n=1 Tax=Silene latifolia TaxID=37657 RepID=UPI003D781AAC
MITLVKYTFSPPQILSFSPQIPPYTPNTCSSAIKFTTLQLKTAFFWPIKVKHPRNVLIMNKSTRVLGDVSETGDLFSLLRGLGVTEKEAEAILVRNPGLGLVPVELIRKRVCDLKSIGLDEVALSRLICKNSEILTAEEVGCLIEFLRSGFGKKIETVQIERLLRGNGARLVGGFDEKVRLLVEFGVSEEKIGHVLNNVNLSKAICLRSSEEMKRMLTFLSRYNAVGIIAKRPSILHYDLDTQLVPRIGFLQRLSEGNTDGVGEALNRLPAIVTYSVEHLQNHVEFFRSYGLTDQEIFKIVLVFPNVMSASVERKLRPRVEFLKDCGLDTGEVYRFLVKSPVFLGLSFERNLSLKLAMLVKIGYVYRTKELAMAMGASSRTRCEYLQQVIGLFLSYGFCCDDIVAMSNKHFQILQYNPKSLEEKMEYLIEEMDREIGELLSFPAFLGYNLDKRIKHRYELKKKIVGEDMSLNKLLSVASEKFSKTKKDDLVQVSSKLDETDIETNELVCELTL